MSGLDVVKAKVAEFERKQRQWAEFGAGDTEPDGEFHWSIAKQLEALSQGSNKAVPVADSARKWQLFSDMNGSGKAARELSSAARSVNAAIRQAVKRGEWLDVIRWARDYCWRVCINVVE